MTDNEIIKALECCLAPFGARCRDCSLLKMNLCKDILLQNALDLINRLQAENDALYKEFAEKLSDRIADHLDQSLDNPNGNTYFITDVYTDIDNLLKELVGEDNGN